MEIDLDIEESDIESVIPESEDEKEVAESSDMELGGDLSVTLESQLTHGNRPEDQAGYEWDGVSYRSPLFATDWKRIEKKQILQAQMHAGQVDGVELVSNKKGHGFLRN